MKIPKIPKIMMFGIDIIKNLLFFTLFIIIFLFLLILIVAPTIKKFKNSKKEFFKTKIILQDSNKNLEKITQQYKLNFKKNKKIIFALKREFNKENFKLFAKKYMNISNIEDKNSSIYQNKFIKKTYIVTASINSPDNFYKFVNATQNYKNILKIYFPIVFKSKENNIQLLFKIEHFKIKE